MRIESQYFGVLYSDFSSSSEIPWALVTSSLLYEFTSTVNFASKSTGEYSNTY